MRKLLLLTIFLVMAIAGYAQAAAQYDFAAVNAEGVTLYYKITDATGQKVMLVNNEDVPVLTTLKKLIVPDKVTDSSGKEYTVTSIGYAFYDTQRSIYRDIEELILPKTIEHFDWQPILGLRKITKITIQGVKSHEGIFFQTEDPNVPFEEIRLLMTTLPENTFNMGGWHYPIFNLHSSMEHTHVIVPADYSFLYKTSAVWKINVQTNTAVPYYEELKIGPNGYTSYYLENENFEVPTGSTAYIIKGATNRLNHTGDAVVEAFPAGSIIPKQTGFILSGTAGSTVAYRACVDGPEVDVTGNLLVGTATEQEFSGTGYKYYIFGNGSEGQGFYHQGTRKGNSMKVGAHRAGLKLPTTGFSPAKPFVFNFEEAVRNTVTGISTVKTESAAKDAPIYNLQGCRVTNPTNGIYIVNGKKVLIKK